MQSKASKSGFFVALAAFGLFLSRWHGGGFISGSPKVLKNILWALPFSAIAFFAHTGTAAWVWAGIALALCIFGKATGHGGGMDLAHSDKEPGLGRTPEKLEYLILWAHGKIPQYWYDVILLAIVGFAAVSGGVLAVGHVSTPAALVIALGGVLKAFAYMVGWKVHPKGTGSGWKELDEATEVGEALTGLFAYMGLAAAFLMVVL